MPFQLYDFVGLKPNPNIKTVLRDIFRTDKRLFFVREVHDNDEYVCDVYVGENLVEKHYVTTLPIDSYEKKDVKATFKIREFHPLTGTFVDDPKVYNTIQDAVSAGSLAPAFAIWGVSIICESDCKAFGIDPAAPWPPKAV